MLRNVEVGCGKPKVIVPIVAATAQGILEKAQEFRAHALDVVEWRVDFYEDVFQLPKVLSTLKGLREILGETPILFTFRTRKEGGEKEIDMEAYTALNTAVAQSGDAGRRGCGGLLRGRGGPPEHSGHPRRGESGGGLQPRLRAARRTRLTCSSACGRCRSWGRTFRRSR